MKKKIILMLLLLLMKTADAACTSGVFAIYKTDETLLKAFKIVSYSGGYGFCAVDNMFDNCTIVKTEGNAVVSDQNYTCFIDNNNNKICTYKDYFNQTKCPNSLNLSIDSTGKRFLLKDSTKPSDNYSYSNQYSNVNSNQIANGSITVAYFESFDLGPAYKQNESCSAMYTEDKTYKQIYTNDEKYIDQKLASIEVRKGTTCIYSSLFGASTCQNIAKDTNPNSQSCLPSIYAYYYKNYQPSPISSTSSNWITYIDTSEVGCEKVLKSVSGTECKFFGKFTTPVSNATNTPQNGNTTNTPTDNTTNVTQDEGPEYDEECGLLGDPSNEESLAHYINLLIEIIKYIGIILCVVLTIVDFAKGLFSEEKELPQNLSKKLWTRLILAISLFFLPMLIKPLLFFLGVYGNCVIK